MEEDVFKSLYERPFAEQIAFNLEQLEYRFARLSEIDTTKKENQKEYLMLFDSFLALFRALLLEKNESKLANQFESFRLNENLVGATKQNRTADLRVTNPLLYQLSYSGTSNILYMQKYLFSIDIFVFNKKL